MKNRILLVFLTIVLVVSLAVFGACGPAEELTLSITAIGEGTTSPAPGTSTITEGESVTITAIPDTGYKLDYWEGDVSGTTNPITFKMTSDTSVVAVFGEGEAVWEWPEKLNFLTGDPTAGEYGAMIGWTTPLGQDTGTKVTVVGEINPKMKSLWLRGGGFIASVGSEVPDVIMAKGPNATRDAGPHQCRTFWVIAKVDAGFMVRGDSGIETPHDLKPGMKISYIVLAPVYKDFMIGLLAWGNIDQDDVEWIPAADLTQNGNNVSEGRADVAYNGTIFPSAYEVEASPHGLAWIELDYEADPEGAARFEEWYLGPQYGVMSTGVPSAIGVKSLSFIGGMSTYAGEDEELVYQLVKWLDENYDLIKDTHPWCAAMTIENVLRISEITWNPLHDGVVRYLEEKGLWTEAHEARRQANIALLDRWIDAYQAAIAQADANKISVNPENEEWMEIWAEFSSELPILKNYRGLD